MVDEIVKLYAAYCAFFIVVLLLFDAVYIFLTFLEHYNVISGVS